MTKVLLTVLITIAVVAGANTAVANQEPTYDGLTASEYYETYGEEVIPGTASDQTEAKRQELIEQGYSEQYATVMYGGIPMTHDKAVEICEQNGWPIYN